MNPRLCAILADIETIRRIRCGDGIIIIRYLCGIIMYLCGSISKLQLNTALEEVSIPFKIKSIQTAVPVSHFKAHVV